MDAFESLVSTILSSEGYWTTTSFKVDLSKEDKAKMNIPTSPRWEIDVLAYSGSRNEVLVVECKSYLDSTGVTFRNKSFEPPERYKLFSRDAVRRTVFARLRKQLVDSGLTGPSPKIMLALATGKLAQKTDLIGMRAHFRSAGWRLFDQNWIQSKLEEMKDSSYENSVAHVCAKVLLRSSSM